MPHSQYRVIFIGDLVATDNRDVVKRNLATLFGTSPGNMDRLFGTRPLILKKNLDRDEAIRFRDAIIRCGAFCRIETMDSTSEILVSLPEDRTGEIMSCPRCQKQQSRSPLCRFCGALAQDCSSQLGESPVEQVEPEDDANRRYYERRRDLETSVNVTQSDERRAGRDRRKAHLDWRM